MQITSYQLKAARGMIDMTIEQLAKLANVSPDTIIDFEADKVSPRKTTMESIWKVLDRRGVELIGNRGVAKRDDNHRVIEGTDCYLRLLDEIFQALHGKPDAEALFICVDDNVSTDEVRASNNRLRDAGIKCRYLSSEKAPRFDFSPKDYRLIPERFYTNSVMVVFDDKVATLRGTNDAVIIVRDPDQANMLRGLFEMIWLQAPMPKGKK